MAHPSHVGVEVILRGGELARAGQRGRHDEAPVAQLESRGWTTAKEQSGKASGQEGARCRAFVRSTGGGD